MTSDAGSAASAVVAPQVAASQAAAATKGKEPARRRQPLTLPEMRSKAAFRACDRLMERGADSQEQLWSVARVMSGEEYEQAAEERALAGKCGNPLCTHPPASSSSSSPHRGRYHISTREQAVYEVAGEERPVYCSPDCQVAVKTFAARLGSGALALDRFTAVYDELKRREAEVNAAAKQAQQQGEQAQQAQQEQQVQREQQAQQAQQPQQPQDAAVTSAAASRGTSAASAGGSSSACASGADSVPGGICSDTPLVPRLAVEQVEVKHIDSSAGQFGDFSRKLRQRPAEAAGGAPRPKGVLKKQSQFAAGTSKVPIMLAEVKERDLSIVEAETARNLPAEGGAPGAPAASRRSAKAAVAVEGYVPRAINSQRQRRVRWSDEVEEGSEEPSPERQPCEEQQVAAAEQPAPEALAAAEQPAPEAPAAQQPVGEAAGAPALVQQQQGVASAGGTTGSVLVFEVEDPKGPLEAGGLSAQMGRLRVADPAELPGTVAAGGAASGAVEVGRSARSPSPSGSSRSSPSPSRSPVSSSIEIQRRGYGAAPEFVVPPEWREAPQFYAHSPVGSSSSLAGSLSSPHGSNNNLAAIATVSSPPKRPQVSSPPGLPRPPSRGGSSGASRLGAAQPPQQAASSSSSQTGGEQRPADAVSQQQAQAPQEQQAQQQPAADVPALTRRQAEQLQRAFPGLSAALPPELQAMLASDSEGESGAEEDEEEGSDWMRSDDEDAEVAASNSDEDEDGFVGPAGRSGFRLQLSFFGTLFTHLEAWVTPNTVELLAAGPTVELVLPPPTSPEVLATLNRFLAQALPPVLSSLQASAPRNEVERALEELLRTLRLIGPLPAFKVSQWQVVVILLLKALSLERCPALRPSFETRDGIARLNRLLGTLSFTSEEFYAALELLCPTE